MSYSNRHVRQAYAEHQLEQQEMQELAEETYVQINRDQNDHVFDESLARTRRAMMRQTEAMMRDNTRKAYQKKGEEFVEYCRIVHGHRDPSEIYQVDNRKLYDFLVYQAFRTSKPKGRPKRGRTVPLFNYEEYKQVKATHFGITTGDSGNSGDPAVPNVTNIPADGLGYDTINQYKCSIKKIWYKQRTAKCNNWLWSQVWREDCQGLMVHVQARKPVIARLTHQEKMDTHFTFFKAVDKELVIEEAMWEMGNLASSLRNAFPSIKFRFMFLFSRSGILRGETILSAELSDCFLISHRNPDKDPHEWDALIMGIQQGKTNKQNKLYGRAMRAKNVWLCPVGSGAFYLFARFALTKEFEGEQCGVDFTDNATWYSIKLLVSFGTNNGESDAAQGRNRSIQSTNYYNCVKDILAEKGITSNHYMHLGRIMGASTLQYKEISDEDIRQLGNWQVTVRDLAYSTKLPLKAMRAAADFTDADGMFYCPRSQVQPPPELAKRIFPWADEQLEKVQAAIQERAHSRGGNYLGSAKCFLEMLIRMRIIILQDAAAMIVLNPERTTRHAFFCSFHSIFRSEEFTAFTERMRIALSSETQSPMDYNLQAVLPGVHSRLASTEAATSRLVDYVTRLPTLEQQRDMFRSLLQQALVSAAHGVGNSRTGNLQLAAGGATTGGTNNNDSTPTAIYHRLKSRHDNVLGMYNEWFGLADFENVPIAGGIAAVEDRFGRSWRQPNRISNNRISRQHRVAKAVREMVDNYGLSVAEVCHNWDTIYIDVNKNLEKFVNELMELKIIPSRGT